MLDQVRLQRMTRQERGRFDRAARKWRVFYRSSSRSATPSGPEGLQLLHLGRGGRWSKSSLAWMSTCSERCRSLGSEIRSNMPTDTLDTVELSNAPEVPGQPRGRHCAAEARRADFCGMPDLGSG